MEPGVLQREPAAAADGAAQRDGPAVLDQRDSRRRARRDGVRDRPGLAGVRAVGAVRGTRTGAHRQALLAVGTEPDERSHDLPELGGVPTGDGADVDRRQQSVVVLADEGRVDQADRVLATQPPQLGQDPSHEPVVGEAHHDDLDRPELHRRPSSPAPLTRSVERGQRHHRPRSSPSASPAPSRADEDGLRRPAMPRSTGGPGPAGSPRSAGMRRACAGCRGRGS